MLLLGMDGKDAMKEERYQEIAESWTLWAEYIDPGATMTASEFEAMTISDRLDIIVDCFGPEQD